MSEVSRVKAVIYNHDTGAAVVECLFNPKEYTFAKTNSWQLDPKPGNNVPHLKFGGGQPSTLQMELLFDTYMRGRPNGKPVDVRREYTDKLWQLMLVKEDRRDPKTKKGEPPKVRFVWGTTWSFVAVITSLQQKFTLFDTDGTPVRAVVTAAFQQLKDAAELGGQNPTSGAVGGERLWTVTEGDTLAWIAYREYGNATRWRPIADANRLGDVRRLVPGSVLVIPNA
jgi:nucleoid-associated protein YgaU